MRCSLQKPEHETPTNTLLANLAVADMLTAIASLLTVVDFSIKDIELGESLQQIYLFFY